jgi:hypothetical protein
MKPNRPCVVSIGVGSKISRLRQRGPQAHGWALDYAFAARDGRTRQQWLDAAAALRPNPVVEAGAAPFLTNASMRRLYKLLPADTADDMADDAFRYAKREWEKANNRILPHKVWPALRAAATRALVEIVENDPSLRRNPKRRRRNPATWSGTEKQIAWAKRIRESALPVIEAWVAELASEDAADHRDRLTRYSRHRPKNYTSMWAQVYTLEQAKDITDARFWIDNREAANRGEFLKAATAFLARGRR